MSEPMCVCGHGAEEHTMIVENIEGVTRELGRQWCKRDCLCEEYRPCPPWPDDEGWWVRESDGEHVKAYEAFSKFWLATLYHEGVGEGSATPDRYCRVPNPFKKGSE